jgi:protein ImuB
MSYAAALTLDAGLFAGTVSPEETRTEIRTLVPGLRDFTPFVEPSTDEPGIFWLCASGLLPLHGSLTKWACSIGSWLHDEGWLASMAVGFDRFSTYALARSLPEQLQVYDCPDTERAACQQVRLERLGITPKLRDGLARLAVHTVGDFLALPVQGMRRRFGEPAVQLRRMASGEAFAPLRPVASEPERAESLELEWPESRMHPLLFQAKRLLDGLLQSSATRRAAIAGLQLELELDRKDQVVVHALRPATPTLDAALLLDLMRLRLEAAPALTAGVVEMRLEVEEVPAHEEQLRLFAALVRRDLEKGAQALARVRAELGTHAVGRFELREGHLPEASFAFVPGVDLQPASPSRSGSPTLMRRLHERPFVLPSPRRLNREDGWQPRRPEQGPIVRLVGPYVLSGGWWQREVRRDYYFASTRRGDLLWVYYDRDRATWFECGLVE